MAYNELTDLVRGNRLMVYVKTADGSKPIAYATSYEFSLNADTVDTSNLMSGKWKSGLTGQFGWTISVDFLYTAATGALSFSELKSIATKGEGVLVVLGHVKEGDKEFSLENARILGCGECLVTSLNAKGDSNGVVTSSASFTGNGEWKDAIPA